MRRLPALFLLAALASLLLSLAGDSAEARAQRKRARRRAPSHTTAVTSAPSSADAPTPPDVVIPRRVLVLGFGGAGAQAARGAVLSALRKKPSLTVVPLRPSDALKIGTNYSPQKTVGLAKRLNLTGVLYGEVTRERGKVTATLTLANGEDARIVGEIPFEARTIGALRTKIRTQLWAKLSPLIDQAASPGRPEEEAPAPTTTPAGGKPPERTAGETPPETETPEAPETPPKPPRREPGPPQKAPKQPQAQLEPEPGGETPEEKPEKPEKPAGGTVEIEPERRPHEPGATSQRDPARRWRKRDARRQRRAVLDRRARARGRRDVPPLRLPGRAARRAARLHALSGAGRSDRRDALSVWRRPVPPAVGAGRAPRVRAASAGQGDARRQAACRPARRRTRRSW